MPAKTRLFRESTEKNPTFGITNGGRYVIRQEVVKGCSNPPAPDTVMEQTIEITGSAASDAIRMETIPFTTTLPAGPATATPATTAAPAPPTTAPESLPPEESPGTGMLSVVTTPEGAQVFVNEVQLGVSPVILTGFLPGSYNLRLTKSGYPDKTALITIDAGRTTVYSATLGADFGVAGIVPVIAAVVVIAAGAGAVFWFLKRRKPKRPDWNNPD